MPGDTMNQAVCMEYKLTAGKISVASVSEQVKLLSAFVFILLYIFIFIISVETIFLKEHPFPLKTTPTFLSRHHAHHLFKIHIHYLLTYHKHSLNFC